MRNEEKNRDKKDFEKTRPRDPIEEKEFKEAAFRHIEGIFRTLDQWERESLSSRVRY
ncbi:MAG: hypothetical protein JW749_06875 [Sedimentisphaerales bacterium]|nr:hypothetical protein [Sedimentisphaerales bacterium]